MLVEVEKGDFFVHKGKKFRFVLGKRLFSKHKSSFHRLCVQKTLHFDRNYK
ncbi:hypothetical protein HMPREF9439_02027 [Parasutterella excrementihominis YIT 11859]|uniref:Uncharacterized protein n=1 Tax=Parasutterella excrementihominis YIT 11859 TaxID=762966 RepID=F3QM50_9BURK|nr:hypothetical protein HMPREF9439_02027 [Parasutterella excrementihominis YIT 11859]